MYKKYVGLLLLYAIVLHGSEALHTTNCKTKYQQLWHNRWKNMSDKHREELRAKWRANYHRQMQRKQELKRENLFNENRVEIEMDFESMIPRTTFQTPVRTLLKNFSKKITSEIQVIVDELLLLAASEN